MTVLAQLAVSLKQHNQSVTRTRQAVFMALASQEPQTMQQIVNACRPAVNRASVYRTITLFEELGIVQRLQIGWKYKLELSNDFQEHHHHATCTKCGTVTALPEHRDLESNLLKLADSIGFVANGHQLELRGSCRRCSNV